MAATNIAVIYSTGSKVIRRVVVSDTDAELQRAAVLGAGESLHLMPSDEYRGHDARSFHAAIAAAVGAPLHSGRCAELDAKGLCVAVYAADPALDAPLGRSNVLEQNDAAVMGHVKLRDTGEFVSPDPVAIPTRDQATAQAKLYAQAQGTVLSDPEAQAVADDVIADKTRDAQKADQARQQLAGASPAELVDA